ncbi:PKD domain-containing protein [Desulfofundulus salinus]|uniref:PKD domain-containing protein n=2 Tax=Desulfofundulus salinus TaxID=2419843 RepID=A0A494WYK8_9FIRM|nr:PKD domain-containing protein [Desulfofundulus salinum]
MEPVADFTVSNPNPEENESVTLRDASEHPGEEYGERIVSWTWVIEGVGTKTGKTVSVSWPVAGTYKITLTVTDQDGDSDSKTKSVVVAAAPPVANISVSPTRILAGREVTISGDGSTAGGGRTILLDQNEWQIIRPNGSLKWSGVQRYPANPPPPNQMFDSPGTWKVRLRVTDSGGNKSEWAEEIVEVLSDQPPVADFWVSIGAVRNTVDNFSLTVYDQSQLPVPDAFEDRIFRRTWTLIYDKNNNGVFGDSADEIISAADTNKSARILQSSNNDPNPKLVFYQTGRYKLTLKIQEEWYGWGKWNPGLQADTSSKPNNECVITVQNLPPYVSIGTSRPEPKADILFVLGQIDNKRDYLNAFNANLPGFLGKLAEYGIDARAYQNDAMSTGSVTRVDQSDYYIYLIGDPTAPIYKVYVQRNGGGFHVERRDQSGNYVLALKTVSYGGNDIDLHADGHGYGYGVTVDNNGQIVTNFRCGHDDSYRTIWVDANGVIHVRYYVAWDQGYNSTQIWDFYDGKVELVKTNTDGRTPYRTLTQEDADTIRVYGSHSGTWELTYTLNYPPTLGKLQEVSQGTPWRSGVTRFLVLMNNATFQDYSQKAQFVSYMKNNSIGLIAEAGAANYSQCNQLVSEIGRDIVFTINDAASDLNEIANYIIDLLGQRDMLANVVLVNQKFITTSTENDRESDAIIARVWQYYHDPNTIMGYTLSNSWGLNTDVHGKTFSQPLTSFSKPGTYTVKYRIQDQPPNSPYWNDPDAGRKWSQWAEMKIYVHRRPVAAFTVSNSNPVVGQTIVFTDQSYDPDLQYTDPEGKKGIRTWEWQYRVNGGKWITDSKPPAAITEPGTMDVRLRVQDALGAWSDWAYRSINVQNRKPRAYFEASPNPAGKNETVTLVDLSTDPDGDRIVAWEWTIVGGTSSNRITEVRLRGNSESNYDYGYLYGWNGSSWVQMARYSGSYDVVVNAASFGNITKLKVRLTTDGSVIWSPTYVEAYQVTINGQTVTPRGLYLTTSSNYQNLWSGEWTAPQVPTESKYYTKNLTLSWANPGSYRVTLKVKDEHGLWSDPYTGTVTVEDRLPNRPPVARMTARSPVYAGETLTVNGTSSYDPDPGDYVRRAYWRYKPPGGDWVGPYTQIRGAADFLKFSIVPRDDQVGQWQFELVVEDSRGACSTPAVLTVEVREGFEVHGSIEPNPGERGRNVTIKASAVRPSDGQPVSVDSMKVIIPLPQKPDGSAALPPGWSSREAWMTYNPGDKTWYYTYTIPERTVRGRWPDDGFYLVKVVGYRSGAAKEDVMQLEIKGHILRRLIIRTISW